MDSKLALVIALVTLACQSTTSSVSSGDPAQREELLSAVTQLDGRWQGGGPDGQGIVEFQVSSNGSAVRELMYPGQEHEMTNMYTLDGNSLVMTHYCAGGNQPHMRARKIEDGRIVFEPDGVSDLGAPDETYMGAMTLVIVDANHIEQHWRAINAPDEQEGNMVFELTRVR